MVPGFVLRLHVDRFELASEGLTRPRLAFHGSGAPAAFDEPAVDHLIKVPEMISSMVNRENDRSQKNKVDTLLSSRIPSTPSETAHGELHPVVQLVSPAASPVARRRNFPSAYEPSMVL